MSGRLDDPGRGLRRRRVARRARPGPGSRRTSRAMAATRTGRHYRAVTGVGGRRVHSPLDALTRRSGRPQRHEPRQGGRGLLATMWRLALARQQLLLRRRRDGAARRVGAAGRDRRARSRRYLRRLRERDLRRAADARRRSRPGVRRQRRVCGGRRSLRGRAPVAALLAARGLHPRACTARAACRVPPGRRW